LLIIIIFIFPNITYGKNIVYSCTNQKNDFLQTYAIDNKKKIIIHKNSKELNNDETWSHLNIHLKIIDWKYPIVIGCFKKQSKSTEHNFLYFDLKEKFLTTSYFKINKNKPIGQIYDCF
jgi:hypothetical protein